MSSEIDIKAIREKYGWTQGQLAEYLGLDRSSVSRMENGQEPQGPTKKLLHHLAESPVANTAPPAQTTQAAQ